MEPHAIFSELKCVCTLAFLWFELDHAIYLLLRYTSKKSLWKKHLDFLGGALSLDELLLH